MPAARLQRNPPLNRFRYIAKTYGDKYPQAVLETFFALADTVGIEHPEREFNFARRYDVLGRSPREEITRELVDEALIELADDSRMKRGRESDALWPWVAQQLVKAQKEDEKRRRDGLHSWSFADAVEKLQGLGPALALWQRTKRINLGQWSLDDALDALEEFEVEAREIPQGEVVHRWPDGWTVQELAPEDLEVEGEVMQHCVGDYCEEVESGETVIYSLRDPQGKPYVTMEFNPVIRRFLQIHGKQNTRPKPEYMKRVDEFAATGDVRSALRLTPEEEGELNELGFELAQAAFDPSEDGYLALQETGRPGGMHLGDDDEEIAERVWEHGDALDMLQEAAPRLARQAHEAVEEGIERRWSELLDEGMQALEQLAWKLVDEVEALVRSGELEDIDEAHEHVRQAYFDADYPFGPVDLEYLWGVVEENADLDFDAAAE